MSINCSQTCGENINCREEGTLLDISKTTDTKFRDMLITMPDVDSGNGHGLGLCLPNYKQYEFTNCVIDFSVFNKGSYDEAAAVTWGNSAVFNNCKIIGAFKMCLLGSGDADRLNVESGKKVIFNNCALMNFGRRGPEVQSGMECILNRCVISNWAHPDYHDVRGFGVWAHHGGRAKANECVFHRDALNTPLLTAVQDRWYHFWQAIADEGVGAVLHDRTYAPGWQRAFTSAAGGSAVSYRCYVSGDDRIIVEGHNDNNKMSLLEAEEVLKEVGVQIDLR